MLKLLGLFLKCKYFSFSNLLYRNTDLQDEIKTLRDLIDRHDMRELRMQKTNFLY